MVVNRARVQGAQLVRGGFQGASGDHRLPAAIVPPGPDQEGARQRMRTQNRNANNKVIVCNKVPVVQTDADLDEMPYAAKGICYLTLGGAVDFMDSSSWPDEYPVIGPESALELFEKMVPEDIAVFEDFPEDR